jgi:hypothetical protein
VWFEWINVARWAQESLRVILIDRVTLEASGFEEEDASGGGERGRGNSPERDKELEGATLALDGAREFDGDREADGGGEVKEVLGSDWKKDAATRVVPLELDIRGTDELARPDGRTLGTTDETTEGELRGYTLVRDEADRGSRRRAT